MVDPLGGYQVRTNLHSPDDWSIPRRCGRVLRRRERTGQGSVVSLSVDTTGDRRRSMGAGVLRRPRQDLGNKLDHDIHAAVATGEPAWHAERLRWLFFVEVSFQTP